MNDLPLPVKITVYYSSLQQKANQLFGIGLVQDKLDPDLNFKFPAVEARVLPYR